MSKYKYSKTEQQINDVLKYHDDELKKLKAARPSTSELDRRIQESEDLLRMLGHTEMPTVSKREEPKQVMVMLFIGHSAATAVNAGKVYFTQNPMAINYPQWIAFAKYSYKQLKWVLIDKPNARDAYVSGRLNEQLAKVLGNVNATFDEISANYIVVFD